MKKAISILLSLLMLLLTGCGTTNPPDAPDSTGYTFTDSTGTTITLHTPPEKVAVLFSSYAEIWTLAGGEVSVTVGESVERNFVPDGVTLVDAGAGKTIDHELLLAAQPDFIIGSADIAAQVETCGLLSGSGIPCALFRVDTVEDYLAMLEICTHITGNAHAYDQYGTAVAAEVRAILEKTAAVNAQKKEILFIRAGSQYSSTKAKRAPDNFVCTMLDELGTHNIASDAPMLLDGLSLEEILLRDPDYIFLTTMGDEDAAKSYIGDLFTQEGWCDLTAVKTGSYTFLPKDLFHFKPNARWAEAYGYLAELLYPELKAHG